MKRTTIFLVLLAFFLLAGSALAMRSTNYWLDWYVVLTGGGGGPADSANYKVNFTVGQVGIGSSTSASYQAGIGYWYGIRDYKIYLPLVLKNYSS